MLNRRSLNQLASSFVMCATGLLCVLPTLINQALGGRTVGDIHGVRWPLDLPRRSDLLRRGSAMGSRR